MGESERTWLNWRGVQLMSTAAAPTCTTENDYTDKLARDATPPQPPPPPPPPLAPSAQARLDAAERAAVAASTTSGCHPQAWINGFYSRTPSGYITSDLRKRVEAAQQAFDPDDAMLSSRATELPALPNMFDTNPAPFLVPYTPDTVCKWYIAAPPNTLLTLKLR